jgi:hypothetical protein
MTGVIPTSEANSEHIPCWIAVPLSCFFAHLLDRATALQHTSEELRNANKKLESADHAIRSAEHLKRRGRQLQQRIEEIMERMDELGVKDMYDQAELAEASVWMHGWLDEWSRADNPDSKACLEQELKEAWSARSVPGPDDLNWSTWLDAEDHEHADDLADAKHCLAKLGGFDEYSDRMEVARIITVQEQATESKMRVPQK